MLKRLWNKFISFFKRKPKTKPFSELNRAERRQLQRSLATNIAKAPIFYGQPRKQRRRAGRAYAKVLIENEKRKVRGLAAFDANNS